MIYTVAPYLSTGFALIALLVAWLAWRHTRKIATYHEWPYEKVVALEATCDEHDVQLAQHHDRLRKMNARLAARERRAGVKLVDAEEKEAEEGATVHRRPDESPLEWKRRIRLEIAKGRIGHGG